VSNLSIILDRTEYIDEGLLSADVGLMEYEACWELQQRLVEARSEGAMPDVLLFAEHPPVITMGRTAKPEHVLADEDRLAENGVRLIRCDRGGDVTFHGPGQVVAYPIVHLPSRGLTVHAWLRLLEQTVIETVATFGLQAERWEGRTGVWANGKKFAAIGVRIRRGVSMHGVAVNVASDLSFFKLIIPCGLKDSGVTSLARLLGDAAPSPACFKSEMIRCFSKLLSR
jgi:lipoic acid synthetase/lipoyl(octanoyl) transferase